MEVFTPGPKRQDEEIMRWKCLEPADMDMPPLDASQIAELAVHVLCKRPVANAAEAVPQRSVIIPSVLDRLTRSL